MASASIWPPKYRINASRLAYPKTLGNPLDSTTPECALIGAAASATAGSACSSSPTWTWRSSSPRATTTIPPSSAPSISCSSKSSLPFGIRRPFAAFRRPVTHTGPATSMWRPVPSGTGLVSTGLVTAPEVCHNGGPPALEDRLMTILANMLNPTGRRLAAGCGVVVSLLVGASAAPAQEPIKIGLVAALSGGSAKSGEGITRGLTVAIDEINAAGGLLGG